jgi:hypothetical protein
MQAEIKNWKVVLSTSRPDPKSVLPDIQMRIGIHTGGVVLGTVGTMGEYTAMGDTVNLSSRLEHAAPVGGILISHETYRHVRGLFELTQLEPIRVKGKGEPVQVYVVHNARPHSFRVTTRGVEGIETRTIGRENELAKICWLFNPLRKPANPPDQHCCRGWHRKIRCYGLLTAMFNSSI